MTSTNVRVVLMTVPDADTGVSIVRSLVEDHLAACGNVVPGLESIFRWKGKVEAESEALVVLKTSVERVSSMMARAADLHPHEVPELLAIPVTEAWAPYAEWVLAETREESEV